MLQGNYILRNGISKLISTLQYLFLAKTRNGKLALHMMFKDEAPFLKEWLDYHLSQGVNHIFLTNDGSSDNWLEVVQPYVDAGYVEYEDSLDHPDFYYREQYHKNRILAKARRDFEWVIFLDSDEFCYIHQGILRQLEKLPRKAAGLVLNWMIYGTAHVEELEKDQLMIEVLNRRFPDGHEEHRLLKSIVRTSYGARFFNKNPHYPNYSPLAPLFWSDGQRFRPKESRLLLEEGHIKHYWYRTEKFFREVKRDRRIFFEGGKRSDILEDWHYRRSNAVFQPMPEKVLMRLQKFQRQFEQKA